MLEPYFQNILTMVYGFNIEYILWKLRLAFQKIPLVNTSISGGRIIERIFIFLNLNLQIIDCYPSHHNQIATDVWNQMASLFQNTPFPLLVVEII